MLRVYFSFFSFVIVLIGCTCGIVTGETQSTAETESELLSDTCFHGEQLIDGTCKCPDGWTGSYCQHCQGRFIEDDQSGSISDGDYDYLRFVDCAWFIRQNPIVAEPNSTLELIFLDVDASCSGVSLRVYDGDGEYAPLLAYYSGEIRPARTITREVIASSGMAFLKFESPAPINEEGFGIFYQHIKNPYIVTAGETPETCQYSGQWTVYSWRNLIAQGRASAAIATIGDQIYVYGGYMFGSKSLHEQMLRFTISGMIVDPIRPRIFPKPRYGHTMVAYKDTFLVYGGFIIDSYAITNELWLFNTTSEEWKQIAPSNLDNPPLLVGHSAHLVDLGSGIQMIVVFGYHPQWRFSNFVFCYDIVENRWAKIETTGAFPAGAYGHASALDDAANRIYIHGGVKDKREDLDSIYVYDVKLKYWEWLSPISSVQRYMHTMVFIDNVLFVYGGRPVENFQCKRIPFEIYNLETDMWTDTPITTSADMRRFGHSSIANDSHMFVYGGFDGIMNSDIAIYSVDSQKNCLVHTSKEACDISVFCSWTGACTKLTCNETNSSCGNFCQMQYSCFNCLASASECCSCAYEMDSGICLPEAATSLFNGTFVTDIASCDANLTQINYCVTFRNCFQCNEAQNCSWSGSHCKPGNKIMDCGTSCTDLTSCQNCTKTYECSWCETTKSCFTTVDGDVFFPFGTCTDPRVTGGCKDPCSAATSCDTCFEDTGCGWCATDIDTGLGSCMSGSEMASLNKTCDGIDWFFGNCPDCQCNGHSTCVNESICTNCSSSTAGDTCEECKIGFYGNPENGGNCSTCECNGHAETCATDGMCNCVVYGVEGAHCDRCDDRAVISGDAVNDTCYYGIIPQYRYEFNFQLADYTQMNFDTCPTKKSDLLLAVSSLPINLSNSPMQSFDVIIAYNSSDSANETIFRQYSNKTYVQVLLRQSFFEFGKYPNRCLKVYLTFKTPFHFYISIIHTYTNIGILLGVFFSVFIVLLIVAIIFWKLNTMWLTYQRRRLRSLELEEMAARPFGHIDFDYSQRVEDEENLVHIGEESLDNGTAAVGSTLMWMPCGDSIEQKPFLAIGSALFKSNPSFKVKARHVVKMKRSRMRNGSTTIGVDNPVLDLDDDTEDAVISISA